jgi:hypothetical protein
LYGKFDFPLLDKTSVLVEFFLWSTSSEDFVKKLTSNNWTGLWLNEATEVSFEVLSEARTRVGRYPIPELTYYAGTLFDTNKPEPGTWVDNLIKSTQYEFDGRIFPVTSIVQPPAAFKEIDKFGKVTYKLNHNAENLSHLKGGVEYYAGLLAPLQEAGRFKKIDSLYCLLDVDTDDGMPVYPTFNVTRHVAPHLLSPLEGVPLIVGLDTVGIHLAAVFIQYYGGKWCVTDEVVSDEPGLAYFIENALSPLIATKYNRCKVIFSVDPSNARDNLTGVSPSNYLISKGYEVYIPRTNKPALRVDAVATMLNKDRGGLLISPHCKITITAMKGRADDDGYHYPKKKLRGSVSETYAESPAKNLASHPMDALQYGILYISRDAMTDSATFIKYKKNISLHNARCRQPMIA